MAISGGSGSGGKGAGDVRAGGAFFELWGKDGLSGLLDKLSKKVHAFSSMLKGIGGGLLGAGAALGAGPLGFLFGGIDRAAGVEDLTDIFGLTAEAASKMAYAFNVAGVETSDLEKIFKNLAKTNTTGKPLDEYLMDVASSLLAIEDPSERMNTATELLTKSGTNFLRVASDLNELYAEAEPLTMDQVKAAEALKQAWTKAGIALQMGMVPAMQSILPLVQQVGLFVKEHAHLLPAVAAGAIAFTGLGVAVLAAGHALGIVATVVGLLGGGPVLALTGLVAGLGYVFREDLLKVLDSLAATAGTAFQGIDDALRKGDLKGAAEIGFSGIGVAWKELLLEMKTGWNDFLNIEFDGVKLHDAFASVGAGIAVLQNDIAAGLDPSRAKELNAESKLIMQKHSGEQQDREQARLVREAGLRIKAEELEQAKDRLLGLAAMAAIPQAPMPRVKNLGIGGWGGDIDLMERAAESVKGGFGGAGGQGRFGYGDNAKVENILKDIRKNTDPKEVAKAMAAAMVAE